MCTKYTPINISGRRERKANAEKLVFLADCATLVFAHSKYVAMDILCAHTIELQKERCSELISF